MLYYININILNVICYILFKVQAAFWLLRGRSARDSMKSTKALTVAIDFPWQVL